MTLVAHTLSLPRQAEVETPVNNVNKPVHPTFSAGNLSVTCWRQVEDTGEMVA